MAVPTTMCFFPIKNEITVRSIQYSMNSWLIRLAIAACVFCITLHGAQFEDFTYTVSGSSLTITKYTGSGGAVVIPGAIDGKSVVSIGDYAFAGCGELTGVTIPTGLKSIGHRAFADCGGLTSITISSSVTSIGGSAFKNCSALTSIAIPRGVTIQGDRKL